MIAFRCSRCFRVNISINEGLPCVHCSNEVQVSSVPQCQVKISTSNNNNDVYLHMQNKSAGADFSVLSKTHEESNTAKLYGSNRKYGTKTLNVNLSHISSPEKAVAPFTQNSIQRKVLGSPRTTTFSKPFYNVDGQFYPSKKSDAIGPTKKQRYISERTSNKLRNKKTFQHENSAKSIQGENTIRKMHPACSRPFPTEKSMVDFCKEDCIIYTIIRLKDDQENTNFDELPGNRSNPKINNSFQDDLKITNTSSHLEYIPQVYPKGCIKNGSSDKLPINPTTTLKKLFLCNKCGKAFIEESKREAHFQNHFKEKLFKCYRCDKEYFSEDHLKMHYKSHTDKSPYDDFCDLVSVRNCNLSQLRKNHASEPAVENNPDEQKIHQSHES